MGKIKLVYFAWLLPLFYLIHLLEEYFVGERFPPWFSRVLGANLSDQDFLLINSIGITVFLFSAVFYTITRKNTVMVTALGSVLFLNGFVHLFSSILSLSYSPGTISGLLIYIPSGYLLFRKTVPALTKSERKNGFIAAIVIHTAIAILALNI